MQRLVVPAPTHGFDGDHTNPQFMLSASRNFSLERSVPVSRRGYAVRRHVNPSSSVGYLERVLVDAMDAVHGAAYVRGASLYREVDPPNDPVLLETLSVDPYGATDNPIPQWVHAYGRTVLVNGTDFRVLIQSGGSVLSRPPLEDPAAPALSATAGGSMTPATWYVRVRWFDSVTGTFSGPSQRVAAAASVTLGGGNLSIQVTRPTAPSRATHWQIQLASGTDTPAGYEITYQPASFGLIPVGTSTVTLTQNPASGTRFQFRTDGAQVTYRHSNPPPAHFVTFFRGRWFYASRAAGWLVWTDVGNPEHFFHNTDDPNQGFNTAQGDGVGNSIGGPCTGLFANQFILLYATRTDIHMGEGSWQEVFDDAGVFVGRRARISPLTQGGLGAVSPASVVVDQDVFFVSARGPAVISGGRAYPLALGAVRSVWACVDRRFLHRSKVVYDPDTDTVLFTLVTQQSPVTGAPNLVLAWQREKEVWCPPWTLHTTGGALQRIRLPAGVERGARAVFGSWHGQSIEFGLGDGDGWDGSNPDAAARSPSSATTTSVTFSGETWTTDEHRGKSLVLVDASGNWHYRQVSGNTADTLSWQGAVAGVDSTWKTYLGGIPAVWHFAVLDAEGGEELVARSVRLPLDDQPSRRGA
jgi:hypothetical protein